MKTKTILLAVASLGLAVSTGFSQGTISFANTSSTLVVTNGSSIGLGTGSATSATGVKIELLYQSDTGGSAPSTSGLTFNGFTIGNWENVTGGANQNPGTVGSPQAGRFGIENDTTGTDVAGGNVWLVAVAWSGGYSSLAAAVAGNAAWYGVSSVWSQGTGNPNGTPVVGPVNTSAYFGGLTLTPTPEPATIALGGLGAAALLLFRRRK